MKVEKGLMFCLMVFTHFSTLYMINIFLQADHIKYIAFILPTLISHHCVKTGYCVQFNSCFCPAVNIVCIFLKVPTHPYCKHTWRQQELSLFQCYFSCFTNVYIDDKKYFQTNLLELSLAKPSVPPNVIFILSAVSATWNPFLNCCEVMSVSVWSSHFSIAIRIRILMRMKH